jgi:hypothetical protein
MERENDEQINLLHNKARHCSALRRPTLRHARATAPRHAGKHCATHAPELAWRRFRLCATRRDRVRDARTRVRRA